MQIFTTTLSQMAFLFSLIVAGFLLVKTGVLSQSAAGVLSKLENYVFIPAIVMNTFITHFTVESLSSAWKLFLTASIVLAITAPLAVLFARLLNKDAYIRNIYTYGLAFSNFGFMGNAVVSALFPEIFMDYLIFTLPFWILIYLWGVPSLLICDEKKKGDLKDRLSSFKNPMFIAMIIGMIIGVSGLSLPVWTSSLVSSAANCMSPVAMLLTGITVAAIDIRKVFASLNIYAVSAVRLLVIPAISLAALYFLKLPYSFEVCTVCALSMPLGLNTIVIPAAYGKDTTVAAGMALISHLLSCITIPAVFALLELVV